MAKEKMKKTERPANKRVTKSKADKKISIKKTVVKTSSKKPAKKIALKKKKALPAKKKKPAKRRKPETLMCFLTTACVDYYSLPDNCFELNTLRNYRDTYLAKSIEGKQLIQEYYAVAPGIVNLANKDKEKKSVYKFIFSEIKKACAEIANNQLAEAKQTYVQLVKILMNRYSIN